MVDRHPETKCLKKYGTNSTLEYHECMCKYDYSFQRAKVKGLKMRHCHEAAEMVKIGSFYSYLLVIAAIFLGIIVLIAALCSCKWYFKTKKNPCKCFSIFCCCHPRRRTKEHVIDQPINIYEQHESGHMWSPVSLPPMRENQFENDQIDGGERSGSCMNFCLSDPVQDCCEFFDCDLMWRKKSVYTFPIFGRKKQNLQRRPTRQAPAPPPPPPKAVILPHLKTYDPTMDQFECEPVPEAPPSPEPIRTLPAKALYVDPLSFLQRPFLKMATTDKNEDEGENKEALYSKLKNMVLSKVKKSSSTASINKLGVSSDPNGIAQASNKFSSKKMKTASLASLHNLDEAHLDVSYGSKRSLSLASLHMLEQESIMSGNVPNDPRSRISVISSTTADDIPPCARKDEYIDLAEMSKRIEAKMRAANNVAAHPTPIAPESPSKAVINSSYTPDFMPASAFSPNPSSFNPNQPSVADSSFRMPMNESVQQILQPGQYYPPVPATQGRPAVPARTVTGGGSIYSMASPPGTLVRSKPAIPPRPPVIDGNLSRSSTLTRSPRPIRPTGPPPPPPGNRAPIESSI